jgi:hypothetical protein
MLSRRPVQHATWTIQGQFVTINLVNVSSLTEFHILRQLGTNPLVCLSLFIIPRGSFLREKGPNGKGEFLIHNVLTV